MELFPSPHESTTAAGRGVGRPCPYCYDPERCHNPLTSVKPWKQERDELVAQIATDRRELAATTDQDWTRREFLAWRIRRAQNRIALIETRLAAIRIEAP